MKISVIENKSIQFLKKYRINTVTITIKYIRVSRIRAAAISKRNKEDVDVKVMLQATSYKLQATSYKLQATSLSKLRIVKIYPNFCGTSCGT